MIIHNSEQFIRMSNDSLNANNREVSKNQTNAQKKIKNLHQEKKSQSFQTVFPVQNKAQRSQSKISEIILKTKQQIIGNLPGLREEKSNGPEHEQIKLNKVLSSPIILSQPVHLSNNQTLERNDICLNHSDNRYNRNNDRIFSNNPTIRLMPPEHRQQQRRQGASKNPLKKLFSLCFGGRENRQRDEESAVEYRENFYEIRDSNGRIINFNVEDSDLLGSFLGVVAAMDSIDLPKKKIFPGIQQSQLKKFKTLIIDQQQQVKQITCAICCNQYKKQQRILKLPCNHDYHQVCISKWLKQSTVCPMCKRNYKKQQKK